MKRTTYIIAGLLCSVWISQSYAQSPFNPYRSGRGFGIGFQYRSGRLSIGGFYRRNDAGGYYGNPYYGPPSGVIQTRVIREIHVPPRIVVVEPPAEPDPEYDTKGEDLDLKNPLVRLGPDGVIDDDPKQPKPPPPLPGKPVSKPKKPSRPGDKKPSPKLKGPPKGMDPGPLPKPKAPLPNAKDEANRQLAGGVVAFRNKQYGLAAQRFQRAIETDADNALAYFLRSQAEVALGFYHEAVISIQEGMKRRLDWPTAKFHPRFQLYEGNESVFDKHLKRLDEVVSLHPKSAQFLFLAGHQYWFYSQRNKLTKDLNYTRRPQAMKLFTEAAKFAKDRRYIDRFLNAGKAKMVASR